MSDDAAIFSLFAHVQNRMPQSIVLFPSNSEFLLSEKLGSGNMDVASTTTASTHVAHLATVDTNTAAVLNGCDDDEGVGRVSAPPVEFNLSTTNGVGDSADGKRARAAFAASRSLQGSVRSLSKAVQQKLTGWREEGDFTLGGGSR
jgi:hypothetical protein